MSSRSSLLLLQQTRQEKTIGLLTATLFLLGLVTSLLFGVWFSHFPDYRTSITKVSLHSEYEQGSGSTGAADSAKEFVDQGTDEQPAELKQGAEELQLVSSLVNSELALLEGNGMPATGKTGINGDDDDGRQIGPRGPSGPVIPAWQRWQIHYSAGGIQEYAAILDAFHVELGVMGGDEATISYARDFTQSRPHIRRGIVKDETRLRFIFTRGDLKEADQTLALQAGLSVEGRIVGQFFPDEVKRQLEFLERRAIGERSLASVRRTVFGIRKTAAGMEFFVERVEPARPFSGLAPL
ncbi:MAG: hypothetical protein K8R36_17250 [Planctomycetales bacterium]|nr:hypothetical protein [Planctomycetales bacterium]